MARHYRCISADSHLDIRPDRWRDRVPERWRERAPRTVTLANGDEGIIVENRPPLSRWHKDYGDAFAAFAKGE